MLQANFWAVVSGLLNGAKGILSTPGKKPPPHRCVCLCLWGRGRGGQERWGVREKRGQLKELHFQYLKACHLARKMAQWVSACPTGTRTCLYSQLQYKKPGTVARASNPSAGQAERVLATSLSSYISEFQVWWETLSANYRAGNNGGRFLTSTSGLCIHALVHTK